jgi:hypothetical protein
MATQTKTQRQAAAKKGAATRKRNAANKSASRAKSSARSTASSARATGRSARTTAKSARTTAKQAARTTGERASAETTRLEGLARQARRALLTPIGVAIEAGDRVVDTARSRGDRTKAKAKRR